MTGDGFKILRDRNAGGTWNIIVEGKSGIALQSCGIDRDEVVKRLKSEINELEARLGWPDEDRIDIIGGNGNDGDHYEAVQI